MLNKVQLISCIKLSQVVIDGMNRIGSFRLNYGCGFGSVCSPASFVYNANLSTMQTSNICGIPVIFVSDFYSNKYVSTKNIPQRCFTSSCSELCDMNNVVVIGAGQMGTGIAITATKYIGNFYNEKIKEQKERAEEEFSSVMLLDISDNQLEKSREFVDNWLLKEVTKNRISDANAQKMKNFLKFNRLNSSLLCNEHQDDGITALQKADLCIEAVAEKFEIKKNVFRHADTFIPKSSILASNTSAISITRLAAETSTPERVVGLHFMNPVPVMSLIEVVTGLRTSAQTVEKIKKFAEKIKKTVACAKDTPGFISNRVLMPYINEAVYALHEGVSTRDEIDTIMKLGTNVPMGPLTLADFIGLDTCLYIMDILYTQFADCKYRPCPLLKQYVDAGFFGRKNGRGFYEYK